MKPVPCASSAASRGPHPESHGIWEMIANNMVYSIEISAKIVVRDYCTYGVSSSYLCPQKNDNLHCQTELDNISGTCPAVLRWGLSSGEQNALDVQLKHPRDGNDVNTGVDPEFLIGPGGLFNDCFVVAWSKFIAPTNRKCTEVHHEWGAIKIFKIVQYIYDS